MPAPTNEDYRHSIKRYINQETVAGIRNKLEEVVGLLPEGLHEETLTPLLKVMEKKLATALEK